MKKLETFVFVHDQQIILDFIKLNKFSEFEGFKYVFLGNRPCDLISGLDNLIITRELKDNIENIPKLTSFTGWYALYKNNLINSEYVNFFEYDVNYVEEFSEINNDLVESNFDFIGYFPMSLTDPVYLQHVQYSDSLVNSIKKNTGEDIINLVQNKINEKPNSIWSSSSNSTWKTNELVKYIEWFVPFINDIKDSQFCGHMHERSISFFYYIFGLKTLVTQGLMTHFQLNSHGTSPLPIERSEELYKMLK
jgi:hypothetical protein